MDVSVEVIRILTRLFYLFPIQKRKVVLTAYNGRQYSCSPKYIAEALAPNRDFDVYYAISETLACVVPSQIHLVKYKSLTHIYHLMTAKYIIVNSSGISNLLPYRNSQILINTWHGGGYFKVMGDDYITSKNSLLKRKISGKNTDYFLASCKVFANQLPRSMQIAENKITRIGLPRNDIFFSDTSEIREKICSYYGIKPNLGIVIYAPTYRDGVKKSINDTGIESLNVDGVLVALEKRFNREFVFMYRAHHDMIPENLSVNCINVSNYDDMQELLACADVLISDYSSCMWDFSLQKKPGFLYTPDLEAYEKEHPFGTKTEDWPYPLCKTNNTIIEAILSFDEKNNSMKIDNYLNITGSYEEGNATDKVIQLMKER